MESPCLFWPSVLEFLNQPIIIAVVSSGVLAVLVAKIGAYFQHRNWKKQERMSRERVLQEKLFDKRAGVIKELFYLNKKREQNVWNLYHARGHADEANKYRDEEQEIVSRYSALLEEIKIYFGVIEESDLLKSAWQIGQRWHSVVLKMPGGNVKEEMINQISREVDEDRKAIQERLSKIIYRTEPPKTPKYDYVTMDSNAASPTFHTDASGTTIQNNILFEEKDKS
jgi:hypothetical protein